MTRTEVQKLVAMLFAAFPQSKATPATVEVYERKLVELDAATAARAVDVILDTARWLPTVAEIRAIVVELSHGPRRSGVDAWGDVLASVRRHGAYRQPGTDFQFQNPLVARCVASMGWQSLCSSENPVADRARFAELYDALATQNQRERQAPALAAATEKRDQLASITSLLPRLTGGAK